MSLAYRKFFSGDNCTIRMVNGYDLSPKSGTGTMIITREAAEDPEMLERVIFDFGVNQFKMNPKAIKVWECKDLGD